jgi:hypothetical protein
LLISGAFVGGKMYLGEPDRGRVEAEDDGKNLRGD